MDLRWFEGAWPAHLAIFNKMLLLDLGIYGFIALRQLEGIGFDLRLRLRDAGIGLREVALYTPLALALGLGLGFLHLALGVAGMGADWWSVDFHILFYCGSGGAFLSRMAAESSGAAHGAHCGIAGDGGVVWAFALQQAGGALQLAICACWRRLRGCFMGGRGGRSGVWERRRSLMQRWTRSGGYGLSSGTEGGAGRW